MSGCQAEETSMSLVVSIGLIWVSGTIGFLAGAWWASATRKGRLADEAFPQTSGNMKVAGQDRA